MSMLPWPGVDRTLDDLRVTELAACEPELLVTEAEPLTLDEVQRAPGLMPVSGDDHDCRADGAHAFDGVSSATGRHGSGVTSRGR